MQKEKINIHNLVYDWIKKETTFFTFAYKSALLML